MNNRYKELSCTTEKLLNDIFSTPAKCIIYGSAMAEVIRARVSDTLPQITLVFRALGTKLEQTILYTTNLTVIAFEDLEVSEAVRLWQQKLEKAFRGGIEISVVPPVCEVPEEPVIEAVSEVAEQLVEDEPILEDEVIEESITEEPQDVSPAEFVAWAVENLRTMNEDKATFKKDIPGEFAMWAATKRTITDSQLLTMLADACPVNEE